MSEEGTASARSGRATRRGYLGLGSNVGDRLGNLRGASTALPRHGVRIIAASSVYETEPVGEVTEQRDFLNACVEIETALAVEELLTASKEVEEGLGRERAAVRHGPRIIDVDLLLLDDVESSNERLTLPHPEILVRRFVLIPLLELDPDLALPDGRRLDAALEAAPAQRVERIGSL